MYDLRCGKPKLLFRHDEHPDCVIPPLSLLRFGLVTPWPPSPVPPVCVALFSPLPGWCRRGTCFAARKSASLKNVDPSRCPRRFALGPFRSRPRTPPPPSRQRRSGLFFSVWLAVCIGPDPSPPIFFQVEHFIPLLVVGDETPGFSEPNPCFFPFFL